MISTTHRSLSIVVRTSFSHQKSGTRSVDFPCATIHDSASGKIAIYYGAADSYVGLAFTKLDEIVDYIKSHSVVTTSDTEIGRR